MSSTIRTQTLKISTARLEFSRDRRLATTLRYAAVSVSMLVLGAVGSTLYAAGRLPATTAAALSKENAALRANLERLTTELAVERSTRAALAREVAQMNEQATALENQLAFLKQQNGRP